MAIVSIHKKSGTPKYKQIVTSIEEAISEGTLKKGDQLPSLNSVKQRHNVSRDTVIMAFNDLKARGVVHSIVGKGYYVLSENVELNQKIFLLFDEFNSFKEDLYNAFVSSFGANVQVDVFFHHFNPKVFSKLIYDNAGDYSHYVIMPANLKDIKGAIDRLPPGKVYILDQTHAKLSQYPSVHQNFEKDIYQGLYQGLSLIKKYEKAILVYSEKKQPDGILKGFINFFRDIGLNFDVIDSIKEREISVNELYVLLDDRSLIRLIKKIKERNFKLAKDIGIISYNDTLLKEVVEGGITTISTDFKSMGERLAEMILNKDFAQIENPNQLIIRNSL